MKFHSVVFHFAYFNMEEGTANLCELMGKNMQPHRYFSYAKVFLFIQLYIKLKNMCYSKKLFNARSYD